MSLKAQIENFKKELKNEAISDFLNFNEVGISKILAWLFDREENHGLKNKFAQAFIQQLNKKARSRSRLKSSVLNKAVILTEFPIKHCGQKRRFDILITTNELCIVIENKFGSKEHNNQLAVYKKYFEDRRKNNPIRPYFVYLDINYQESKEDDNLDWIKLNYDWIYDFLEDNISAVKNKVAKLILKEFQTLIDPYDSDDYIDKLCLNHHKLIEKTAEISQQQIEDFIFRKSSFDLELYKFYRKYQWIVDELIKRNKLYDQIELAYYVRNNAKYKKNIYYNSRENVIEFTHLKTLTFAVDNDILWGSFILLKHSENGFSLELIFNLGQFREQDNFEQMREELSQYLGKKIKRTDNRITVKKYPNKEYPKKMTQKNLVNKFDELFSILIELQEFFTK